MWASILSCTGTSIYFIRHSTETSIDHGISKEEHQAKQYSTACPTECDEMFGGWRGRALFLMSSQYYSSISSISSGTVPHVMFFFINIINIKWYCSSCHVFIHQYLRYQGEMFLFSSIASGSFVPARPFPLLSPAICFCPPFEASGWSLFILSYLFPLQPLQSVVIFECCFYKTRW